ncbi:vomeronasal type-1 receptor 2-like [Octodon degus]|uniref:Vomeronasal type-1 receptor n=1 Tax=Octodon degus TaxID=10160 RepID=A0A6P6DWC3_OCTDE|nr:vomeronasal type-1 receptor 2-like [Octodon degus]
MTYVDLKLGLLFLLQIVIGILGNLALWCHYCSLYFSGCRSRSTDVILRHLTVANSTVIVSRGIPEAMAGFGLKHFLNAVGCKLIFYAHRVGRGVSVGSTCLLSVFQAISISPRSSWWAELKIKVQKYIGLSNSLCWVLNMLLNVRVAVLVTDKWSNRNITKTLSYQHCSAVLPRKDTRSAFGTFRFFYDIVCLSLMVWASASMVFILYRHEQQVLHIHRHGVLARPSPGTRASQSILVLVSAFMLFYTLSSVIHILLSLYYEGSWWLINTSAFTNACFATASPFILMGREGGVLMLIWKK